MWALSLALGAFKVALALLYFWNNAAVTSLTFTSVHCADRIVATSNSSGFVKRSAIVASGYVSPRMRMTSGARTPIGSARVSVSGAASDMPPMLPGGRRGTADGHRELPPVAGAVLPYPRSLMVDVYAPGAVRRPVRAVPDERRLFVDRDERSACRRRRGDERLRARHPGVHDVPMRREQDRREMAEARRPYALGVVGVGVERGIAQARDARAAAAVRERAIGDAVADPVPHRRAEQHLGEVRGVASGEEDHGRLVDLRDDRGIERVVAREQGRRDRVDTGGRVMREAFVDPALVDGLALGRRCRGQDQHRTGAAHEQRPVDVGVPVLELGSAEERVRAHAEASAIALPKPGSERSTMSSLAVTESRNQPGISNIAPGRTKTSWPRNTSAKRRSSSIGDRTNT